MNLRSTLFVKIFVGFWLVTTAVLCSWMIAARYFENHPGAAGFDAPTLVNESSRRHSAEYGKRTTRPPPRFVLRTIYTLQNVPEKQLAEVVAQLKSQHGIDTYLLQPDGGDLLQRPVPDQISEAAQLLSRHRRHALVDTDGGRLLAHKLERSDTGALRAVFRMPSRHNKWLGVLGQNLWLRLGLAIVISGAVCYGLSRLMTNRLKELQLASRKLAQGELDTRMAVKASGGDETDELARDFNSMAEQLQARIDAQRRLLGDVSHELRSPLARLHIALALAQQDAQNSDSHLRRIEQEAERLEELISQLLSSQEDCLELDTHIDLVPLLNQLCANANFEGAAQNKHVVFRHSLEQAIVASSGDLLYKSFDNILRNALHHTAKNTTVDVDLSRSKNSYHLRVTDRGPGVPETELARIFEPFYRVDTARTRGTGGYGLGLAITRRAIVRHGGRIEASNRSGGLSIDIDLPA